MRMVFGLVLIVGLGLAGFAVYMAKNYIQGYQAELANERAQRKPAIETVEVYVADKPLKYGEVLREDSVRIVSYLSLNFRYPTYGRGSSLRNGACILLGIDSIVLQILRVLFRAVRGPLRVPGNGYVNVIGRWSDRQNAADRLDPKLLSVIVNERDHLRNGRSSSA